MIDCRASEQEIKAAAVWAVGRVKTLLSAIGGNGPTATPGTTPEGEKTLHWHHAAPFARLHATTSESLTAELDAIATAEGANPCAEAIPLSGRIARMSDAAWWARNLRRETVRANERQEHAAGVIRRKGQVYCTHHAVKVKATRAKANRATLDGLEVVNEAGQAFNLQEIADKSISNPKLRRGELMMRARGFEETAEFMGHAAIFLTITCPSRFHRWNGAGKPNPAWDGATPKDAQLYLCDVWAKIRAAWGRRGIVPYGFRVAEPHHDACPHWHILLFIAPGHEAAAVSIAHKYALQDSPTERGAIKHRFTVERIDTTKGSATGYIAKYIAKNIDGLTEAGGNVGLDFASGQKASDSSARVRAWASTWGVRQFQQIGGPSVTVWRELRRLGAAAEGVTANQADLFDAPQNAANMAQWSLFWMLQGGPDVRRQDLTLKPAYTSDDMGKYGDEVKRVSGVMAYSDTDTGPLFRKTRLHTWTLQRAGQSDADLGQAEHRAAMQAAAAVTRFLTSVVRDSNGVSAARAAWTGVNNCTGGVIDTTAHPFDFSGFEREPGSIPYLPEYSRAASADDLAEALDIATDDEAAAPRFHVLEDQHEPHHTNALFEAIRIAREHDANGYRARRG